MLHIVDTTGPGRDDPVVKAMFEARKRIFIDLLKWDVPVIAGRYEIDQFDDEHASYLILADPDGAHLASTRLLPTTRAHILGDLYPHLCGDLVPRAPNVLEITRFCLDRRLNAAERRLARNRLVSAIADYALDRGIAGYTGVAELSWLQQILAFGWRCRPLGLPMLIGGATLGALAIDIDPDTPALLAHAGIYTNAHGDLRHAA